MQHPVQHLQWCMSQHTKQRTDETKKEHSIDNTFAQVIKDGLGICHVMAFSNT